MDAIQPRFPMKIEFRSQMSSTLSVTGTFTIIVRLKSLETCYFDIPNLDDAIKLAETLDALTNHTGFNSCRISIIKTRNSFEFRWSKM